MDTKDTDLSQARRDEVEALSAMEGMDLADPAVMAGAWGFVDLLLAMPAVGEDEDFARIQDYGRDLELSADVEILDELQMP